GTGRGGSVPARLAAFRRDPARAWRVRGIHGDGRSNRRPRRAPACNGRASRPGHLVREAPDAPRLPAGRPRRADARARARRAAQGARVSLLDDSRPTRYAAGARHRCQWRAGARNGLAPRARHRHVFSPDRGGDMRGCVSFVSSGPGDPDLMTLRAAERLRTADVVLFDDLSAGPILAHARPGADLVGVGKRAGRPSAKQDHVSRLLIDYALTGARVVRLKSGDSGHFGRPEEEIIACREAGVGYEIVPGVPSAMAAAAAAGIPLTRRLTARRVQFITGHDVTGSLPEDLNLAALADPTATTVVFMGKRTFGELARRLRVAGMPPETPALLAESVSTPAQKLVRGTLGTMEAQIAAEAGDGPALILLGPLAEG